VNVTKFARPGKTNAAPFNTFRNFQRIGAFQSWEFVAACPASVGALRSIEGNSPCVKLPAVLSPGFVRALPESERKPTGETLSAEQVEQAERLRQPAGHR
jgi:hypothetical protein